MRNFWKVGQRVIWHRARNAATATILELRTTRGITRANLRVDGWVGTTWETLPLPNVGTDGLWHGLFVPFDPPAEGEELAVIQSPRSRNWHLALVTFERDTKGVKRRKLVRYLAGYGDGYADKERVRKSISAGPNKVASL